MGERERVERERGGWIEKERFFCLGVVRFFSAKQKKNKTATYEGPASRVDRVERRPFVIVERREQRHAPERPDVPVQVEGVHIGRDAVTQDLAWDRRSISVFVAQGFSLSSERDLTAIGGDPGESDAGVSRDRVGAGVGPRLEHLGHEEVLDALGLCLF